MVNMSFSGKVLVFASFLASADAQSMMMSSADMASMMSTPSMASMMSTPSMASMMSTPSMASMMSTPSMASMMSGSMSASMSMPPLTTATAMPGGATQRISVGNSQGQLVFDPNVVFAPVGTKLEFMFYPRNHSVVQGDFSTPCQAMPGGIYSGFIPSQMGTASQMFTAMVNQSDPMWLYCSQEDHCRKGMVMVVNPSEYGMSNLQEYMQGAAMASGEETPNMVNGGVVSNAASGMDGSTMPTMSMPMSTPSMGASQSAGTMGAAGAIEPKGLVAGAIAALVGWFL